MADIRSPAYDAYDASLAGEVVSKNLKKNHQCKLLYKNNQLFLL